MMTTWSASTRSRPAVIATCSPKFRISRMARSRGSAAVSRSISAQLPSVLPSSTNHTSKSAAIVASAGVNSATSAASVASAW